MDQLSVLLAANWGMGERLLSALMENPAVRLVGVVTRSESSGKDSWADAVRNRAQAAGLPVWDESLLDPFRLGRLVHDVRADNLWIHAFMRRLPREIYTMPRRGTVNIHGSLLPAYRGPSPHQWVLKNRDLLTGLTSHFVDEGLDTGPIIHQETVSLSGDETLPVLLDKLKGVVLPLVHETVNKLLDPDFIPMPQDGSRATYAPRLMQETS